MADEFAIKDSGKRQEFSGGMMRDTTDGKVNFLNVRFGPMLRRWAAHLTKGRAKYPDVELGVPNWTLAAGPEELLRFKESAARHFEQWLNDERDEDHASAVFFNINGAEDVRDKMEQTTLAQPNPESPGLVVEYTGKFEQCPEYYTVRFGHTGRRFMQCRLPKGHKEDHVG